MNNEQNFYWVILNINIEIFLKQGIIIMRGEGKNTYF